MRSIFTRFRAYQLGEPGSSFSYFADGHFTLLEGRLTDHSRPTLLREMENCSVNSIDMLHITSWDADHCQSSELPDLLRLTRPTLIECPGYEPHTENGIRSLKIIAEYIDERRNDNRTKTLRHITPEYVSGLKIADWLAFENTLYNPLHLDGNCANDNSTVKHFRRGCFNVLSLGDVESHLISARLRGCKILRRDAGLQLAHVVAGDVLHHLAAGLPYVAPTVDRREAEEVIARRPGAHPTRSREIARQNAAQGRFAFAADEAAPIRRLRISSAGS